MFSTKFRWPLVSLLSLGLLGTPTWSGPVHAQGSGWNSHFDAGVNAYLEKEYAEAGKRFLSAIATAEQLGPDDPRVATSLNALGEVYRKQGKYAEAEAAHGRALRIREKILESNSSSSSFDFYGS